MCTYPAVIGLSMLVRFGDVVTATFDDGHTGMFDVGTLDVGDGGDGRGTGAAGRHSLLDIDIDALIGRRGRGEGGRPSGIDAIVGIVGRRPLLLLEFSDVARVRISGMRIG